ncbi:MAG: rod shape-determining protein MreD [Defluviitaleaceae bacterium]|nr:rod shape-determining protein MreD [Defluviitaleaceae bacterium]MCL2835539.1 rod shape-determining protein MreD [Defluviitaleaceae bacterium]
MLRAVVIGSVIYGNFLLQTTLLRHIAILGVVPMTAMLVVVSYAILRGDVEGAIAGFCAGLLQDVFFMEYIGLYALLFAVTGFICGKPFRDFFTDSFILPVTLTLFAMIGYEVVFYFINFTMRGRLMDYFRYIILPETIYTMLLAIPVYRLMFALNKRLERHEKKYRSIF